MIMLQLNEQIVQKTHTQINKNNKKVKQIFKLPNGSCTDVAISNQELLLSQYTQGQNLGLLAPETF